MFARLLLIIVLVLPWHINGRTRTIILKNVHSMSEIAKLDEPVPH